ncbi:acetate--CoA ligase family protein [bacterium]|nr:acetate--CoA ligase family protein [bacterium]
MRKGTPNIKFLFEPRSVAIIGASQHQNKIGYKIVENIRFSKYPGKIYPVNPKGGEILGLPVYRSLDEIRGHIDMAVLAIPAKIAYQAVKDCARCGVKFLVLITSGFSEVGNTEGERKIVAYAHEHQMRILGPNIFGIYSSMAPLNATFGMKEITPGSVAIITQSGALGLAMIGKTAVENIGLSAIVSVGNKSDINEADLLGYLASHKNTKVILMYIEGVKDGDKLVDVLKETTPKKPVVVIKSGRSKVGAMAAASHTGSLAGADEIFSDIMTQCGVLRAESIQEAFAWCKFLASAPTPKGENTVIITNGGGLGVLAADACEKYDVQLYNDIENMKKTFSGVVPEFGSLKNPVDITGQATMTDYEQALNISLKNRDIHSIICLGCETAVFAGKEISMMVKKIFSAGKSKKPLVFSFVGGVQTEEAIDHLKTSGIPIFSDVYEAVSCFGTMYVNYHNTKNSPAAEIEEREIDIRAVESIIKKARDEKRQSLLSWEARGIIEAIGIHGPESHLARNLDEAIAYAEKLDYPVVMKVVSRDILHKSDVGGVALDLLNRDEVIDAYGAIMHSCREHVPEAIIEGVEISQQVEPGLETIIGARRDRAFGPIVMFGLGGIYVEVMKDVSFRALPLNREEAGAMIKEIKSYPLLLGVRGEKRKDIDSVIDTIMNLSALIQKCKSISDIEINPLVVYEQGDGAQAVDARILISSAER